ncbi:unnamed protein product [Menidia menidia]|uniref:(Atlantic silverside) hypothetical protein n=1 Tax=Menidia menidia TaxID=238744 RepID=A0A8S4BKP2_9TELE|nr:unnamed protein product [Menidia menidia]
MSLSCLSQTPEECFRSVPRPSGGLLRAEWRGLGSLHGRVLLKGKEHSSASELDRCTDGSGRTEKSKKYSSYRPGSGSVQTRMARGVGLGFLVLFLLVWSATGLLLMDQRREAEDHKGLSKAILEMLHIDKVSASHHAKPHPYMRRIYQYLDSLEAQDFGRSDGLLVQSFRSVDGPPYAPPGWIWFNVSGLDPSMLGAELVLFRKTLHPRPLSVTVSLHSVVASRDHRLRESPPLEERQLTLDQRPSSGYDVFDVSDVVRGGALEGVGFQLRYTDERGSLVLHQALTQSLYCLDRGSLSEPLLVLYREHPLQA